MNSYQGSVHVGGPPDVHELAKLVITKVAVGPMDNNAYLLRCRDTGAQLLIDAANDAPTLLRLVNGVLDTVVTTHRHADHWQALAEVVDATSARTIAGRFDVDGIDVPIDESLNDGDIVRVGTCELTALHIPGHTPGAIVLLYDDPTGAPHLFTGDTLFPGGPGKTTSPDDFATIMDGLERRVFGTLPDETWVYPGLGDDTTIGDERPHLADWRARGW
jgi:glyoxylase-like metal-dependent hydrolase (beta-lactamase superfamily II)